MSKDLKDYTKEELLEYIKSLKKAKKFGLVWEDKPEQVVKDVETKLPVLEEASSRAITTDSESPTHLIIEGDNYHSLSTLNYTHAGEIDVIYIDPPYNTGNKDFIYNDNYVDKEDSFRHSKWLSFMNKRLKLAKDLLSDTGVIFISIDDNEQANLKLMCDSVFGESNFVCTFIWQTKKAAQGMATQNMVVSNHEYILVYARNKPSFKFVGKDRDESNGFSNPDNDPRGLWKRQYLQRLGQGLPERTIVDPVTGYSFTFETPYAQDKLNRWVEDGRIIFPKSQDKYPARKEFLSEYATLQQLTTELGLYATKSTTEALYKIFDGKKIFNNPKPDTLMVDILDYTLKNNPSAKILDFFAGSGTTGHAVLKLNKKDGGSRQFILCTNNENGIAENITYERIKRVVSGYGDIAGIPANVRYFKTEFVDKQKTNDQTRLAIVDRSADLIRVRENAFETVIDDEGLKVFRGAEHLTAIVFEPDKLVDYMKRIEELGLSKVVHLYVFSLSNYAYQDELPDTELEITACPIPESILEVYQRIFRKRVNNV